MPWQTTFTSVAALKRALDTLGVDGRAFVNTYGELQAYLRRSEPLQGVDEGWLEGLSNELRKAEELRPLDREVATPEEVEQHLDRPLTEVEWVSAEEIASDTFFTELFEGPFLSVANRLRLGGWFPTARSEQRMAGVPPIITFYSFKGGVGRSTALALSALKLAQQGYRVAVVDMDLEAPGVTAQLQIPATHQSEGVVDYLFKKAFLQEGLTPDDLRGSLLQVSARLSGTGEVRVLPAGKVDAAYPEQLARIDIDLAELRQYNPLRELFYDLSAAMKPDVILVDSRTGVAEVGGPLLFRYSTAVVSLFYGDEQSKAGVNLLLSRFATIPAEMRPSLIWVHSLLRHRPGEDAGFHADAQTFLRSAYEDWRLLDTADDAIATTEELDHYLHPIQRMPLDRITENLLVEGAIFADYLPLVDRIQAFLPPKAPPAGIPDEFSAEDRRALLSEIVEGFSEEEPEQFASPDYFAQRFLVTPALRDALDDSAVVVVGGPGSGKTSLYWALRANGVYMRRDSGHRYLNGHGPARESDGWLCPASVVRALARKQPKSEPEEYWERFWAVYTCLRVREQTKGMIPETCWSALLPLVEGLSSRNLADAFWPYLTDDVLVSSVRDALREAERYVEAMGYQYVLLYDSLEEWLGLGAPQNAVVNGLLAFWQGQTHRRRIALLAKVFLSSTRRADLHPTARLSTVVLRWAKDDIHELLVKRAVSSSTRLHNLFGDARLLLQVYRLTSVHATPSSPQALELMINTLFGERLRMGKGRVVNWFASRLSDGRGELYPRPAVNLVRKACQAALQDTLESGLSILPSIHLVHALPYASSLRLAEVKKSYPRLEPLLNSFQERNSVRPQWQFPMEPKDFVSSIGRVYNLNEGLSTALTVELLNIGVLDSRKLANGYVFCVPDLYLFGSPNVSQVRS